jgi:glycerol-3-phosphate acyltransferase PlsY
MIGEVLLAALLGYLLGAVPTGVLVCRVLGTPDILQTGSTHTGALNVSRSAGVWPAVLTFVVDGLLGASAVGVAQWLTGNPWAAAAAGAMAVVGHNWSVFIRFGGGIGLTKLAAAQVCFSPLPGLAAVAILGLSLLGLIKLLGGHRARATMLAVAAIGPVLWALRVPWPGILLGALGGVVVIIKASQDWNRQYS